MRNEELDVFIGYTLPNDKTIMGLAVTTFSLTEVDIQLGSQLEEFKSYFQCEELENTLVGACDRNGVKGSGLFVHDVVKTVLVTSDVPIHTQLRKYIKSYGAELKVINGDNVRDS